MAQMKEYPKKYGAVVQAGKHMSATTAVSYTHLERQALRDKMRGITPPDKLTKTQKKIWLFMKFHPEDVYKRQLLHGADHRSPPGRDLRPHVAGLR